MPILEWQRQRLEELNEQRRRIDEQFDDLVHRIERDAIKDFEGARLEAQHLTRRHQAVIEDMLSLFQT